MMPLSTLVDVLVVAQALGALYGAVAVVWGEIAYVRAARDGEIDAAERAHLGVIAHGLRFGMSLLLLASLGLVVVDYLLRTPLQPAVTASYWLLTLFSLLIIVLSWALSRNIVSFATGSAALFAAWWLLAYLTTGWLPTSTFGAAVALYAVAAAIFFGMLTYSRRLAVPKNENLHTSRAY